MAVSKKSEKELVDENKVLRSSLEGLEHSEAECRKAENALQETTQFLEAILDTTNILIAYLDPQFNFIKVNKAYALADEKEPSFFPGKNHFDLYPNEENEAIFRRVVETGESYFADAKPFAYAGYPERGFSYWDWSLIPINNQHKSVTGLVLSLANVTERELAEEALKAEKEFIETALNAQQDTFFVFKPSTGRAVRWNKVFNDVSGFSDEEIRSMKAPDGYYNEEDLKKAVATTEKIRNEGIATVELSLVTKDGKTIPTEYTASAINDYEGNLRYIIAIGRDITERKKTEEALRESEGKLEAMLRSLVDHMSMMDKDLNIIWANETAKKLFGDDIVGMKCYKAYHGRNKPCEPYPCLTLKAFQDGKVHEHDTQVIDKDGSTRYFHCSANVALRDEQGNPTGVLEISEDITERKLEQEALKESEEKFRSLAEQSPNMIFINRKGKVVYANKKCEEKMGYTREEFYSPDFDFINLVAPESLEKMKDIIKRRSKGEDIEPYEYTLITKTGKRIEAINSSKLIQYEGQTAVLGIVTDITDRKLAEEALRESENSYRAVVENAAEGIVVVQDQTLHFVNPALVSMMGYSEKELLTRSFVEFIHPDHRELAMGIHLKRFKGEEVPPIYEFKVLDKKGNVKWLENNGILIEWRNKPATLNFLRDVTERKKAEQTIWTSESEKRSILNAIPDQILFHDTDLVIRWGNEALARSIGMTQQELVGRHCYELWHNRSEPCERCPVLRAIETRSHTEGIVTTPDGKWWEVIGEPVCDRDGKIKGAIEIARDITDRKKVEEKLLDYQAKLKSLSSQLTLTEERERHQIATELHATIGQSLVVSKLQLDTLRASVPSGDLARTLDEVCNSLNQTIQNVRSLTFDLSSPILYELGFETAVAEWLTERIQKKHGIATELEDDGQPKPLNDDIRAFLFRDVRELLINVVKHAQAEKIKVSIRKVGKQICVSVEDDGKGFNVEDVAVIAARKSGFGLFSIRERLEQLWGQFEIESEPGRGTKVTMTAPLKCEKITDGA